MSFAFAFLSITMALGSSSPEKQHPDGVGVLPLTHTFEHGGIDDVEVRMRDEIVGGGPVPQTERLQWADWLWDRLRDDEKDNLVVRSGTGTWVDHFVGLASRSQIQLQIETTIGKMTGKLPTHRPSYSFTELDTTRRAVLKHMLPKFLPGHMFGDICNRLPDDLQQWLKKETPEKPSLLAAKKLRNREMASHLQAEYTARPWDFSHAKSDLHEDGLCCVVPGADSHNCCKPSHDSSSGWSGASAGIPCIDVSQMNKSSPGDGGTSYLPVQLFFQERVEYQEDVILLECTRRSKAKTTLPTP